jgi:hypothetical protein
MPPWVFYTVFGTVLVLIQIIFLLLEGGQGIDLLLPVILFNGLMISFVLGLIHYLDNLAVEGLTLLRPMLTSTDSEFEQCKYNISNMRLLPGLVLGLVMVSLLIYSELFFVPVRYAPMDQMPAFAVVYHIFDKLSGIVMGLFLYHTYVQLRMVRALSSDCIRINLYNQGPLQAFSKLTAVTAVGVVLGVYGWMMINPDLMTQLSSIIGVGLITVLALIIFLLPLYSVHRVMDKAKQKELHDIDLRFEAVFSRFNKGFDVDDYPAIEKLNATIASLEIQRRRVEEIHTWPWRAETGRIALTMIALPLIMTIIRFAIDLAIGW